MERRLRDEEEVMVVGMVASKGVGRVALCLVVMVLATELEVLFVVLLVGLFMVKALISTMIVRVPGDDRWVWLQAQRMLDQTLNISSKACESSGAFGLKWSATTATRGDIFLGSAELQEIKTTRIRKAQEGVCLWKHLLPQLWYGNCLESVEEKLEFYKKNKSVYVENINGLKWDIQVGEITIRELRKKLEKIQKEKDSIQFNVDKFKNASKSLNKLIECQIVDNCKKGLGYEKYNAVPPPYTGNFMPPTPDLSFTGLDEFVNKPVVENRNEEENVSQTKTEKKIVKPSIAKIEFVKPKQQEKTARKTVKQVEKHRQNTHSPRGNQRNWNNMMSQKLGSNFEMFNKACSGPDWLFDIDALTRTMNYEPIVADYILLPLWTADPPYSQDPKSSHDDGSKPSSDNGKKKTCSFESTNSGTTAKLPILKLENGNSWVSVPQTAQENGTSVTKMCVPVTAEEKTNKKNDVKARSLLLMALPNEHQLSFSPYENFSATSAESLDSIFNRLQKIVSRLAILGVVIAQEDLNSKFLSSLPPEWNTHVVVWMNKPEVDTMSIDDLYNNFKIVEQKVKKSVGASSGAQNLAFMTAPSTSSTNDANTASPQVSTASPNVNTASPQVSTASLSDNDVYAFMVENPNGSDLLHQDLEQIHEDDLEAIDLKWQLSLLSMREKRYYQRTRKKIFINANDTTGYDKSKVECFNCHKMGHFVSECRAPRSKEGQFRNQDNTRKQGNNEDTSSKEMLAIDGVGFDWSDMAEE
ncbi:putative ribonuclease H-like domain-containing protein [Tanacetum coccineum]|uniref:Ribonuclease H-like domain-containing protein n=1 Tax=Tanacetum coccineum TaxID=301880 RepID=A0ABQ5H693_9ASTR